MISAVEFMSKLEVTESGCWEWHGWRSHLGYGRLWWHGHHEPAHRVAWELFRGPIPPGLHIDHLCMNPPCANPQHLEPVTQGENTRRGKFHYSGASHTHCARGHERTPENQLARKARDWSDCKICHRERQVARKGACDTCGKTMIKTNLLRHKRKIHGLKG